MNPSGGQQKSESKVNETNQPVAQNPEGFYSSEDLFGENLEVTICHNGELYRLRKTKTGKLILNK